MIIPSKRREKTLTQSPRGSYICLSSNKAPSSPPSGLVSKTKLVTEEKCDDVLHSGISDDFYFSSLCIDRGLKIGDVSGGNIYINIQNLSQQD